MLKDNQIIVASIYKTNKVDPTDKCRYESTKVSYDRGRLVNAIEKQYNIKLVKDDADEFPYFSDGGFKFQTENDNWKFNVEAHVHDLI
jgi:hypothetical protein